MGRRHRRGRPVDGLLLVDKPSGITSNAALQRVKRLYGAAKAGHTGTLDPLATGMLPVMFGEATKLGAHLIDADKAYETTLVLGLTTDTLDADGEALERREVPGGLDARAIDAALAPFRGEIDQVPPMVSAIRVGGRRLHEIAREGGSVIRAPRRVTLHEIAVVEVAPPRVTLRVRCSKGTYIRSLVDDLGRTLGCGAHVERLRRLWVAPFDGALTHRIDALEAEAEAGGTAALDARLLPVDAGLGHLPVVALDAAGLERFRHGNPASAVGAVLAGAGAGADVPEPAPAGADGSGAAGAVLRVRGPDGALAGLGEPIGTTDGGALTVRPVRVLVVARDTADPQDPPDQSGPAPA